MTIKITAKDVGRKVTLRNGNVNTIMRVEKDMGAYAVKLDNDLSGYDIHGSFYGGFRWEDEDDIIAFADEPKRRGRPRKVEKCPYDGYKGTLKPAPWIGNPCSEGVKCKSYEEVSRAEFVKPAQPKAAEGKTLRDEFAMAALTGMLATPIGKIDVSIIGLPASLAEYCYELSDAMMAAREGK